MTKDWQRLADAVLRRRAELGRLTQADISHRAGISLDRIQAIEGAKSDRYRRVTLMALEQALEWEPGSIEAILDGGDPALATSGQPVDSATEWDEIARLIAEYRRLVAEIIARIPDRNRASVGTAADLTVSLVEESTGTDQSK